MRLRWTGLRRPPVPADVAAAVDPADGDRLLAWAANERGTTVVAGRHRLHVVAPDADGVLRPRLDRPWHLVDAGTWSEAGELTVTWVDGEPPLRVVLDEPGMLPETLRERVQASVVLAETVALGPRRNAKVVVRRDLETGSLLSQAVLGKGVRSGDPGVSEEVRIALARVREQVGLD